jgi:hypothetical protein
MTIALIDGDVVAYMAGFASQSCWYRCIYADVDEPDETGTYLTKRKDEFDEFVLGLKGIPCLTDKKLIPGTKKLAELCVNQLIENILRNTQASDYKLFLTSNDKSNFRYKIAKTKEYKGNRKAAKPHHYGYIRDYLWKVWGAKVIYGQEADDALGIEQINITSKDINGCNHGKGCDSVQRTNAGVWASSIICSIDKDLRMIPGFHYNIKNSELSFVTEDEAMRFFWKQMLMGDTVDNIPGVPKIGKKKSADLIDACNSLEACKETVKMTYEKYYGEEWHDKYQEMGNLLWIRREENQYFEDLT